jgi:dTDP-4-amino-4,6-dideoxygalactose transaminase
MLVDIDPVSFNIDPADVANRITERTKAVIAVHLFGLCAEMDALRDVCGELPIIEDAACAAGAAYHNQPAGALGLAGAFSFHPRKTITTGEGGMVTTHSAGLAEQMNVLRNHGASVSEEIRHHGPKPYLLPDFNLLGFNYRMTDLQASVGLTQLAKLDRFVNERRAKAEWYGRELADLDWLITPDPPAHQVHSYQAYVCRVDPDRAPGPRNDLMEQLQQQGISTRPGTHAVHMLGYYQQRFGFKPDDLPASRDAAEQTLALPLHNRMTDEDYQYVVDALHQL